MFYRHKKLFGDVVRFGRVVCYGSGHSIDALE